MMLTRMGWHEDRSTVFRANALVPFHLKHKQILFTTCWGSTLYPSNNRMWKFLENKGPRAKLVIAQTQGKSSKNPILMNLKECWNFYVNGRVMSEETVLNIMKYLLNTQKAGFLG